MNAIVRWAVFLPVALVVAALVSAAVLVIGDYLVGGWRVSSGFIIYNAAAYFQSPLFYLR